MKGLAATLPVFLLLTLACTSAHTPAKETPARLTETHHHTDSPRGSSARGHHHIH